MAFFCFLKSTVPCAREGRGWCHTTRGQRVVLHDTRGQRVASHDKGGQRVVSHDTAVQI